MASNEFEADMQKLHDTWMIYANLPKYHPMKPIHLQTYQKLLISYSEKYHMDTPDIRLAANI